MSVSLSDRFHILERDAFRCRYCGRAAPDARLQVDHIMPRSAGGTDDDANLVTACFDCNQGKHTRVLRPLPGIETRQEALKRIARRHVEMFPLHALGFLEMQSTDIRVYLDRWLYSPDWLGHMTNRMDPALPGASYRDNKS